MTTTESPVSGTGTYAEVNGIRLYYEIHGSGRPVILLHGGLDVRRGVRAAAPGARRRPQGDRARPPGARPDGRHRPPDRPSPDGRRHRRAHRAPGPRQARSRWLLPGWRRRVPTRGHAPRAHPAPRHRSDATSSATRSIAAMLGQQGQVECRGGRVHEADADVPAICAGRAPAGGLPATPREDGRSRWPRTSTSARRSAGSRSR